MQSGLLSGEPEYADGVARHFNYLTAESEMKMDPIATGSGAVYDFSGGDAVVAFAEAHGMGSRAMRSSGTSDARVGRATLAAQSCAIASRRSTSARWRADYRGPSHAWDVVNEAVADDGSGLRDTVLLPRLGPDYIAEAFRLARERRPEGAPHLQRLRRRGSGRQVRPRLRPGKGPQGARRCRSTASGSRCTSKRRRTHNRARSPPTSGASSTSACVVNISEMDVRVRNLPGDAGRTPRRPAAQLSRHRCDLHGQPRCHAVTFWGFTDKHSWIDAFFGPDDPLLFDEAYRAKPAFFGVQDALLGR